MMLVTVGVITLNESETIDGLLQDILAQDYCKQNIELVFADGKSSDDTKSKLIKFRENNIEEFYDIKVLDNDKVIQSSGWNVVIKNSIGDAIIRVDAHSRIPIDFVSENIKVLETGEQVCGGRIIKTVMGNGIKEKILLMAENSMFGSSPAKYRRSDKTEYVKTVAQACYRREVFDNVGLFDEGLLRSEDTDMHYRIRKNGYKILMSHSINSKYYARNTLNKMCKQKYKNGHSIAVASMVKDIRMFSLHHFIPYLFLLALIATSVLFGVGLGFKQYRPMIYPFIVLNGLYAFVCVIFAIKSSIEHKQPLGFFVLPFMFVVLHLSYGVGTFLGFIDFCSIHKYKKQANRR